MTPTPFQISISDERLAELRQRLQSARFPKLRTGAGWRFGTDAELMRRLVTYWLDVFDWRRAEAELNRLRQFHVVIDGLAVHFVHERGRGPNPTPLVLAHGWPGSFAQMVDLIPRLTDPARFGGNPAESFDVVVPSLPGYAFSDAFPDGGPRGRIAQQWQRLMHDVLGYRWYGAHGGDIGSDIVTRLGLEHASSVIGIHLTDVRDAWLGPESAPLTPAERRYREVQDSWYAAEGGYDHIQATKPSTLAYALSDSPLGTAAWIVEKFRAWSDCQGDVERRFSLDQLLTNIALYVLTDSAATSIQLYYDRVNHPQGFGPGERVSVPTGVALFPAECPGNPPREWAERSYDVSRWVEMPRGGHFPSLEEPELLAGELRAFFVPLAEARRSAQAR
jgi:pimeloyl-ACP methyl ester carboxylesterase